VSVIIPSSSEDKVKIRNALKEISNSMTRIDAEKDHIKTIIDDVSDEVEVSKKYLRKMATIYHKQNLNDVTTEMDDIETLYNTVLGGSDE